MLYRIEFNAISIRRTESIIPSSGTWTVGLILNNIDVIAVTLLQLELQLKLMDLNFQLRLEWKLTHRGFSIKFK